MKIEKRDGSLSILPYDLIVDILSRLPVKSLVRFKSVSKSWFSLFTDPCFVKMQLNRSGKSKLVLSFIAYSFYSSSTRLAVFSYDINDHKAKAIHIDSPHPAFPINWISFFGSCDGLILCVTSPPRTSLLLNPSTRELNRLPDSPLQNKPYLSYGFGYDASADDYKIVEISCSSSDENTTTVFTLKTNSWRRIQDFPYSMLSPNPGILCNGALHWVTYDVHMTSKIVSFDLAKEKFQDFHLPDFETPSRMLIGVIKECLCITVRGDSSECWVLEEYGKRESWTKVATFPYHCIWKPLNFSNNDEIQFLNDRKLVTYNLKNNAFKDIEIPYTHGYNHILGYREAEFCLESIVSPRQYQGQDKSGNKR